MRSDTEVIWAILRALGKRVEHLRRSTGKVWWIDAETWLAAHRINEMVVLCAQHLGDRRLDKLTARLRALGIALSLVYGGPARIRAAATTDLGVYLTKQRDPPPRHSQHKPWPGCPDRTRYGFATTAGDSSSRKSSLASNSCSTTA